MKSMKMQREEKLLLRHYPVVSKSGWLPAGLWQELDECREVHEEAIAALAKATTEAQAIGDRFRAEDEARIEAYKTGLETPTMTDPAERGRLTAEAKAKFEGARESLAEAVATAIALLEERGKDWIADLEKREGEAEAKREQAAKLLAEAQAESDELLRTKQWVGRSSGEYPRLARLGHHPFDSFPLGRPGGVGRPAGVGLGVEGEAAKLAAEVAHVG